MKYVLVFDQNSDLVGQRPHDSVLILQNCNQLIQTIEDTGTILREIRDLEEQVKLCRHILPGSGAPENRAPGV